MRKIADIQLLMFASVAFILFSGCGDDNYPKEEDNIIQNNQSLSKRVQFSEEIIRYFDDESLWENTIPVALVFDETIDVYRKTVHL
ncbi:MAG: hypothetical protein WC966_03615 [Bradymonadales bacterium]|jgi:hypothetical protein